MLQPQVPQERRPEVHGGHPVASFRQRQGEIALGAADVEDQSLRSVLRDRLQNQIEAAHIVEPPEIPRVGIVQLGAIMFVEEDMVRLDQRFPRRQLHERSRNLRRVSYLYR